MLLRVISYLFLANVEVAYSFVDAISLSERETAGGLSHHRAPLGDGAQLHCGQPGRRSVERGRLHHRFRVRSPALFLFSGSDQRVRWTGSVSRGFLCAARAFGRWNGSPDQNATIHRVSDRNFAARGEHECALSQSHRQALAAESAGRRPLVALLGLDLGRVRIDSCRSPDGEYQNYLRLHRAASGTGRLAGRFLLQGPAYPYNSVSNS